MAADAQGIITAGSSFFTKGGGTITEDIKVYAGADAFGEDAMSAVSLSKTWMEGE